MSARDRRMCGRLPVQDSVACPVRHDAHRFAWTRCGGAASLDQKLMRHLIVSRELPPAAYPAGGIGTYVANISRLLADAGETVHLIGQRWRGAPDERVEECDHRLVTHRVSADQALDGSSAEVALLHDTSFPAQAWGWNAALRAEQLVEAYGIDVIEAQEWEAPLYYFLLRRALGLGPSRQPPCIIQLHSPSEYIWRHNKWPLSLPGYVPMRRQEEYCIASADALLCPSHYLAREAEERYRLGAGSVTVIPIPLGRFQVASRKPESFAVGPVMYVGRLEPRKGLTEFVEAAIQVAPDFPGARFEFLGADTPYRDGLTMTRHLRQRIPRPLSDRFAFRGVVRRDALVDALAGGSFAVVPSRWENFPNSCIEAMASGLPVLASPNGGMVEMVTDGTTGWIAASQAPKDLAAALRRGLSASPDERAAMGRAAASAIRAQCGADTVVAAQLRFRERVREAGSGPSRRIAPGSVPAKLTTSVAAAGPSLDVIRLAGPGSLASALRHGARRTSLGVVVAHAGFDVDPAALPLASKVLEGHPEIGLIAGWIAGNPVMCATAPPAFPWQWFTNDANGVVVFRRQALEHIGADVNDDNLWELANAVLAAGWRGVTLPAIIGRPTGRLGTTGASRRDANPEPVERLRFFRDRYPALFEADRELQSLLLDAGADLAEQILRNSSGNVNHAFFDRWLGLTPEALWKLPLRDKVELFAAALRDPRRTLAWLRTHTTPMVRVSPPVREATRGRQEDTA